MKFERREGWTNKEAARWLKDYRDQTPQFRTDEVSDEEVIRAILSVPTHRSLSVVQPLTVAAANSVLSLQSSAFGASPTNGNTIILGVGFYTGLADTPTISDTAGNTYTQDKEHDDGSNRKAFLFRCTNITGGANFKITVTSPNSAFIAFTAIEVSGLDATPADGSGSGNDYVTAGTGTTATTGTFSTTNANDLIVAFEAGIDLNGQTYTPPGGFTNFGSQTTNSFVSIDAEYKIVAATQTNINPTWGLGTSSSWIGLGFAYKAAAGGTVLSPWWYYGSCNELSSGF